MKTETEPAIIAKDISKTFHISEDSHNTVKHRLFNLFNPPKRKDVLALKLTSLEIQKGECVGLLGRNGCGKTTLTKVLAGVYPTDTGFIKINGSTMLMNLGVGMSHELIGLFAGGVQRNGMIHVVMNRERHVRVAAVDRTR